MKLELIAQIPDREIRLDIEEPFDVSLELRSSEPLKNVSFEFIDTENNVVKCKPPKGKDYSVRTSGKIIRPKGQSDLIQEVFIHANNKYYSADLKLNWVSNKLNFKNCSLIVDNSEIGNIGDTENSRIIIKNSNLKKDNLGNYISFLLLPEEHIPEQQIDTPAYVRVQTEGNTIFSIQAFRKKVSFGKGALNTGRDSDIRMFQPLSERLNEQQLVNDDFQSIQSSFSKTHFRLEFNNQNQLIYKHLATLRAKLPNINNVPFEDHNGYEKHQNSDQLIFDLITTEQNNQNQFTLDFSKGKIVFDVTLTPNFYASIRCKQLPHLGEVVLFNTNNPECENVPYYCFENPNVYVKTKNKQWFINYFNADEYPVNVKSGNKISL